MRLPLFALLLCVLSANSFAQQPEHVPVIDGYVTRSAAPRDFDANGFRVVVTGKTEFAQGNLVQSESFPGAPDTYLGAHVLIFGKLDKKKATISAQRVLFVPPDSTEVKGSGPVDSLPPPLVGETRTGSLFGQMRLPGSVECQDGGYLRPSIGGAVRCWNKRLDILYRESSGRTGSWSRLQPR